MHMPQELWTPSEEIAFSALHDPRSTTNPKFLGTPEAYFGSAEIFQTFLIFAFIGCPYSVICHISMYLMVSWPDLCPLSLENVYLAFLAYHMVLSRDLGY